MPILAVLGISMARRKKETLVDELEYVKVISCDPDCYGRCRLCPAAVIQKAIDFLVNLEKGRLK